MNTKITVTLLTAIAAVVLACAGSPAVQAQTQGEMNIQAGQAADKADVTMNAAYK